jgi:hypothetical protein
VQTIDVSSDELEISDRGPKALPEATETGVEDAAARRFLESDYHKPAVQFGCGRTLHPFEESLEEELKVGQARSRLRALSLLMKAGAPASVDLQWKTLRELRGLLGPDPLLDGLQAQFSERVVLRALEVTPPENRYRHDFLLEWYVRAAGVIRCRGALPTLIGLSRSEHLGSSLAAERSLEDFDGDEGDQALAQCLLGWQYDAYIRAGRALLERNKPLLVEKLSSTLVPEKCRYWQAILLARADEPAAVPLLCETVASVGIIDREMFDHIGRLARKQDLPQVRLLALKARPEQQERVTRLIGELTLQRSGQ